MPKFPPNTGFVLGTRSSKSYGKTAFKFKTDSASIPGTPVYRKDLEGDILGEANKDGSIFINSSITPNSEEERHIVMHEMIHSKDMKTGKLGYTDYAVTWNGIEYPREKGKILYNGEWLPEGSKTFPWEKMPWDIKENII